MRKQVVKAAELDWHSEIYRANEGDVFFDTPEWKSIRRRCFYRDNQRCLRCDKRFKFSELSAHHMVPRAEGGADELTNLATLCHACHDYVEVHDLRTRAAIMGSLDDNQKDADVVAARKQRLEVRTDWKRWVYGGQRHNCHICLSPLPENPNKTACIVCGAPI